MNLTAYGTMYYVDNMDASISYFKKMLGCDPGYTSKEWAEFNLGSSNLCLHAKHPGKTDFPANGVLIINRDGVKTLFEQLQKSGEKVFGLHEVHPQAWSFHLHDPSGNEYSFYGKP